MDMSTTDPLRQELTDGKWLQIVKQEGDYLYFCLPTALAAPDWDVDAFDDCRHEFERRNPGLKASDMHIAWPGELALGVAFKVEFQAEYHRRLALAVQEMERQWHAARAKGVPEAELKRRNELGLDYLDEPEPEPGPEPAALEPRARRRARACRAAGRSRAAAGC